MHIEMSNVVTDLTLNRINTIRSAVSMPGNELKYYIEKKYHHWLQEKTESVSFNVAVAIERVI